MTKLLERIPGTPQGEERRAVNAHFLTDAGLTEQGPGLCHRQLDPRDRPTTHVVACTAVAAHRASLAVCPAPRKTNNPTTAGQCPGVGGWVTAKTAACVLRSMPSLPRTAVM